MKTQKLELHKLYCYIVNASQKIGVKFTEVQFVLCVTLTIRIF